MGARPERGAARSRGDAAESRGRRDVRAQVCVCGGRQAEALQPDADGTGQQEEQPDADRGETGAVLAQSAFKKHMCFFVLFFYQLLFYVLFCAFF